MGSISSRRCISFKGKVTYDSHANDYFFKFAFIDGKSLVDMLEELFPEGQWKYSKDGEEKLVKITLEEIESRS